MGAFDRNRATFEITICVVSNSSRKDEDCQSVSNMAQRGNASLADTRKTRRVKQGRRLSQPAHRLQERETLESML
jgi:hypothetical protein